MVLQTAYHPEGTVVAYLKVTKGILVIYIGCHCKYCAEKAAISSLRIFRSNKSKYSDKTSDKFGVR